MKSLKHIINGFIWTVVVAYLAIIISLQIPFVQKWIGSQVSDALCDKLGTKVTVGRVYLGFLNRIIIDDVTIYDQEQKLMIGTTRVAAKIDYYELLKNMRIYISSAQIFGFNGHFYKENEATPANYQFMLDSLASKDTSGKNSFELSMTALIIRHGSFSYDRHDIPSSTRSFCLGHLGVSDISAHITAPYIKGDSLKMSLKNLSFREKSGLDVKNISFDFTYGRTQAKLTNFNLKLPHTSINAHEIMADYSMSNGNIQSNTLRFIGVIDSPYLSLSDFSCFVPAFKNIGGRLSLNLTVHGNANNIKVDRLSINTGDDQVILRARGGISGIGDNSHWHFYISRFHSDMAMALDVATALSRRQLPVFETVKRLDYVDYTGNISWTTNKLAADGVLATDIGQADIRFSKHNENLVANVSTSGLDIGKLTADRRFGILKTNVELTAKLIKGKLDHLKLDGTFPQFDYNGYSYTNLAINGTYINKVFSGAFNMDDPNGQVQISGRINTDLSKRDADVTASVRNFDPALLNLTSQWKGYKFDFDVNLNTLGTSLANDMLNGKFSLSNFTMSSADNSYTLNRLEISSGHSGISLHSDFGWAEITGHCSIKTVVNSFANLVHSKLPSVCARTAATGNKFSLNAEIDKTDWLNMLFKVPVTLSSPLRVAALVDENANRLNLECSTSGFTYGESAYEQLRLTADTPLDTLYLNGFVKKVMDNGHKLDIGIIAKALDDNLSTTLQWNNNRHHPITGTLNAITTFDRNDKGRLKLSVNVRPSTISVNDTTWNVLPSTVNYDDGVLSVKHFSIEHDRQHIKVSGTATSNPNDSITIDLQDVDVNYVLNLVNFHSVDFSGLATGQAQIKSVFFDPDLNAQMKVSQFRFQDGRMGDLYANVRWNKQGKQIDIDANAYGPGQERTVIKGFVSPSRNYINLGIEANNTNVEFLESFCGSFMDNINARANGKVSVVGPLNAINLVGGLTVSGDMRIKPLNVTYSLNNDTISFLPDNIVFTADTIRDRNGNIGIVNGNLYHDNLKNLRYDIGISAHSLLCYDTHSYGNDTFYGTAYGSGLCTISGGKGLVDIDMNITPERGSFIEYNATNPESISDQQFITWHDKTPNNGLTLSADSQTAANADVEGEEEEEGIEDIPSDMRINFLFNMTPEATLRVLMDKTTGDYISLNGTGSIRASYFNKGSFDMFGTYVVDHGTYKLTIQNIIKKAFTFQQGGTIVFGGDPYNAALRLKAIYTVNGVPLSDLQIGKSFSGNNIRVDCIMNITGTPKQPRVDFDIDLPTVNSDAAQMVRTVINSEEEMNQQVVYLLGVGRFYVQKNNNAATDEQQQTQTSLAMQSLLSGTLSQQINTLLGTLVKNNNWTFGANISTGDEGFNNAEYEGLLSGRLLNNRLVINGQFGYRDNQNATTSFIGDFDINYLLLPSGSIALKVYNQTNDRYFTKSSLNTQGIGLIMKKDFNSLMELFGLKRKRADLLDPKRIMKNGKN